MDDRNGENTGVAQVLLNELTGSMQKISLKQRVRSLSAPVHPTTSTSTSTTSKPKATMKMKDLQSRTHGIRKSKKQVITANRNTKFHLASLIQYSARPQEQRSSGTTKKTEIERKLQGEQGASGGLVDDEEPMEMDA
jgi:hypothetical protein